MLLLLTGGLGFIGSHCAVELLSLDHQIIIVDNLLNSNINVLNRIKILTKKEIIFYQGSLLDIELVDQIFQKHNIDLVIHLAGLKSVAESVEDPLKYYHQNIMSSINLLSVMKKYQVKKIIFSSSATVYGTNNSPLEETMTAGIGISNTYSRTKYFIEEILKDMYHSDNQWSIIILRYFNPCGAHPSGLLGENPNDMPNNLMPVILRVADGIQPILNIYGSDYPTKDGTCIRDFIHVVDLAKGHVSVLDKCTEAGIHIYNLGMGCGYSVKEMVDTFQKVNNLEIKYQMQEKRPGDLPVYYASVTKANRELGWICKYKIEDICWDSWYAYQTIKKIGKN